MKALKLLNNKDIAKIALSKPPLNILNIDDLQKLSSMLKTLRQESKLKLIVIESDQKVFSAGVDISDHSSQNAAEMLNAFHEVFFQMLELDIPTVSLVRAGAIGGGCELALFCDFVLTSENAYFSLPEIKVGCFPPVSMLTENKKMLEMIMSGRKVYAQEALASGLINHVFKEEDFEQESQKFIDAITSSGLDVIKTTISAYKRLNSSQLREKLRQTEKIYLEEIDHDKIKKV